MIERIIELSARNPFAVFIAYLAVLGLGIWAVVTTPLDAIPDLSENQVIVFTQWMGRSPQLVEDQVTFPLETALQGIPEVHDIRAQSMFGMSFIYVIFNESADLYWARSRVMEKLASVQTSLPSGAKVELGPDGTGVGHVFWYTLEGRFDLGTLRSVQDWYVRLNLQGVQGVAEVASVGGFARQYQVDADPYLLRSYGLTIADVRNAVMRSNNEVGGKIIESSGAEYSVRGEGYIHSVRDIETIPLATAPGGTPVLLSQVARVQLGGDIRRGSLERDGEGEVVGGIVVMRSGENAKDVIDRVKKRIDEIRPGLPPGMQIRTAYDRETLIMAAVGTLERALAEAALVVTLVVLLFLLHVRSVLRVIIEIPFAVLIAFIFMRVFGVSSNIMSLGGIALAIGVIVDASIVLVENAYRNVAAEQERKGTLAPEDYVNISIRSARQVGPAIFTSVAIMVVSFLPVFLLEGEEGKLFRPLAFTKTFVLAGSAIIAITLVPVLMTLLTRGKFRTEERNPVTRTLGRAYAPVIRLALKYRKTALGLNVLMLIAAIPMVLATGSEFMPPLDEGSLLFMPVALPSASITEVNRILRVQDAAIREVPEVESVLGKAGRAESSTDPAPVSMIETIVLLRPKSEWRPGMTKSGIIAELDGRLRIPGVRNGWTQPIINRINMLSTGIRTDLGVKIFGRNLDTLEALAVRAEGILRAIPGAADVYAERSQGGGYLDIDIDRESVGRFGVSAGDVENVIETALGGENIGTVIEGRERFPIRVRYTRDWHTSLEAVRLLPVPVARAAGGARELPYVPLGALARIAVSAGPPMIASENGQLRSVVLMNVRGRDMGGFVGEARETLAAGLRLPAGYTMLWSGQWESQVRARARLELLMPLVFLIIYLMLYFVTKDYVEAAVVMLSVPFALVGGVYFMYILGYNFSVAVWVGFIALYGLAVETGVVMVIYLHESLDRRLRAHGRGERGPVTEADITEATVEGAVLRLRPKVMTVGTAMIALVPIMWSTGTGADVMRPLVAPMIGGLITSTIHVLVVTPVLFVMMKRRALRKGRLEASHMSSVSE